MSTIAKQVDGHCHYTGSLSRQYLQDQIDRLFPGKNIQLSTFLPQFSSNWESNFQSFFESYQKIQEITKSTDPKEQYLLYMSGSYDICKNYILEGVSSFELRAGPKLELKDSIERLSAMNEGFEKAEKELNTTNRAKILLTLIHDQNGKYTNVTPESLTELIKYLATNKKLSSRVIGFDFSGPENSIDIEMFYKLLDIIENNEFGNKKSKKYLITVHAGEYSNKDILFNRLKYIDSLLDHKIDRLSHGTILWLDPSLIDSENVSSITKWQNHLLNKVSQKQVIIEICPTANLLLSPLKSITDIPFSKFDKLGIKYTINTDNKTLFNTTLAQEISLCTH